MRAACLSSRQFQRRFLVASILSLVAICSLLPARKRELRPVDLAQKYPLLWQHVHMFNGTGGGAFPSLDLSFLT